jgi:anti-sigma B factor antagonist
MLEEHAHGPSGIVVGATVHEGRAVVALQGDIDIATVKQLERCFGHLLGDSCSAMTLDMARVTFVDSSGLQAFIKVAKEVGTLNFLLKDPSETVSKLIRLTGLQDILRIQQLEASSIGGR